MCGFVWCDPSLSDCMEIQGLLEGVARNEPCLFSSRLAVPQDACDKAMCVSRTSWIDKIRQIMVMRNVCEAYNIYEKKHEHDGKWTHVWIRRVKKNIVLLRINRKLAKLHLDLRPLDSFKTPLSLVVFVWQGWCFKKMLVYEDTCFITSLVAAELITQLARAPHPPTLPETARLLCLLPKYNDISM